MRQCATRVCAPAARATTVSRANPAHTKRQRISASPNVRAPELAANKLLAHKLAQTKKKHACIHEQLFFGHTVKFCEPQSSSLHDNQNTPHPRRGNLLLGNLLVELADVNGELANAKWNHRSAADVSSLQRNNLGEKQLHGPRILQVARRSS